VLRLTLYPILYFISVAGTLPLGIKRPGREANIDLHLKPSEVSVFMSVRKYARVQLYLNISHIFPKCIDRIITLLIWVLMSAETSTTFLIYPVRPQKYRSSAFNLVTMTSFRTLSN
jgi:hypothetical protein